MTSGPRYFGKYRATVLNNLDPQNQGRILVQLGDCYGLFPSTWALPSFPFAAKGMAGIVALPQIGSAVWVDFEAGDPDYPIWSGGFFPDPSGFPALALAGATPATPNIHLQTTTGTSITLSDNPLQQVLIKTASGASVMIGSLGITLDAGPGGMISMIGTIVNINNGALVVK